MVKENLVGWLVDFCARVFLISSILIRDLRLFISFFREFNLQKAKIWSFPSCLMLTYFSDLSVLMSLSPRLIFYVPVLFWHGFNSNYLLKKYTKVCHVYIYISIWISFVVLKMDERVWYFWFISSSFLPPFLCIYVY